MHDEYYSSLPNTEVLMEELNKYIDHCRDCLQEDGIRRDVALDIEGQMYAAMTVRANIIRIYDEQ